MAPAGLAGKTQAEAVGEIWEKKRDPSPSPGLPPGDHFTWFRTGSKGHAAFPPQHKRSRSPLFFFLKKLFIELFLMLFQKKKKSKFR